MTDDGKTASVNRVKYLATDILSRPVMNRWFATLRKDVVSIFMLHRASGAIPADSGTDPDFLGEAIRVARERRINVVSLREIFERARAGRRQLPFSVAFTMDDGFYDQAEILAPVFEAHQCPVTVFLISGFLDGYLWPWDDKIDWIISQTQETFATFSVGTKEEHLSLGDQAARRAATRALRTRLKGSSAELINDTVARLAEALEVSISDRDPPGKYRSMTWQQARMLESRGVEFGPHSVSHRIFAGMNDMTAKSEIEASWGRLQDELSNPVPIFGWPTGRSSDFTRRDIGFCKSAGLIGAVATEDDYGYPGSGGDETYAVKRFAFPDNMADFLQYASWIERGKQIVRSRFVYRKRTL